MYAGMSLASEFLDSCGWSFGRNPSWWDVRCPAPELCASLWGLLPISTHPLSSAMETESDNQSQNFPEEVLQMVSLVQVHKWPLHNPAPRASAFYSFLASQATLPHSFGNKPQIPVLGCKHFQQQLAVPNKWDMWCERAFDSIGFQNINQNYKNQGPGEFSNHFLLPLLSNCNVEHRAWVIWNTLLSPKESEKLMLNARSFVCAFLVFQKNPQYQIRHLWNCSELICE